MTWWAAVSRIFGRGGAPRPEASGAAQGTTGAVPVAAVPVLAVGDDPALALASEMIRAFEGCARVLPDGRIAPYLDTVGVATIGWGNTAWQDGTPVTMRDTPIPRALAEALFTHHLGQFMRGVRAEVPAAKPNEAAAFCCFAYNVGIGGFRSSSALRAFRGGDLAMAGLGLELWNKAGGRVVKGLQRRRRAESLVLNGMRFADALRRAEAAFP